VKGVDSKELLAHLARHPRDVSVVVAAGWRLRRRAWWRRAPFLPLPGTDYWEFRLVTANATSDLLMSAQSIVEAATWSVRQRRGSQP
jgi:hypothetical protein